MKKILAVLCFCFSIILLTSCSSSNKFLTFKEKNIETITIASYTYVLESGSFFRNKYTENLVKSVDITVKADWQRFYDAAKDLVKQGSSQTIGAAENKTTYGHNFPYRIIFKDKKGKEAVLYFGYVPSVLYGEKAAFVSENKWYNVEFTESSAAREFLNAQI